MSDVSTLSRSPRLRLIGVAAVLMRPDGKLTVHEAALPLGLPGLRAQEIPVPTPPNPIRPGPSNLAPSLTVMKDTCKTDALAIPTVQGQTTKV
jgi:hypothetical protein